MGRPSPRKTDLVWKSGMLVSSSFSLTPYRKVFEGKESKRRSGREESSALQWAFRGTSFKDKELRQASELQLRDRGGRQPLAIRQKE